MSTDGRFRPCQSWNRAKEPLIKLHFTASIASGAKAPRLFSAICGTAKAVPFQSVDLFRDSLRASTEDRGQADRWTLADLNEAAVAADASACSRGDICS
jgi:hypothetical protein